MTTPYLNDLVTAVCAPAMSLSARDGQFRCRGVEGLYVQDVRALSRSVLTVNGSEPLPLGYELVGGPENEFHGAVTGAGNPGADLSVFVSRRRSLRAAGMVETFTVTSHARSAVRCRVQVQFGCDLAPMAALRRGWRPGGGEAAMATGDGLVWEVPDRASVRVACSPGPAEIRPTAIDPAAQAAQWELVVEPGEAVTWSVSVEFVDRGGQAVFAAAPVAASGELSASKLVADAVDQRLERFLARSLADLEGLRMVALGLPGEAGPSRGNPAQAGPAQRSLAQGNPAQAGPAQAGPAQAGPAQADVFLAAGAPWYLALFGRDSIWAARLLLPLGTELAGGTLRALALRQGRGSDKVTSEEPGKILHEVRRPDMVAHLENECGHNNDAVSLPPVYYGTVDATPLWVCLLRDAWKSGMPAAEVEDLLEPMRRCLAWVTEVGCRPDGFVSYIDESGHGLANQGWKDSWDGVQFRDGRIAGAPLALCEVQGYAYEAAMAGAELLDAFGRDRDKAEKYRAFAAGLAERFRDRFWVEDDQGAFPAIALEASGAPVDSLTSNIGHLLGTGILSDGECELVASRLLGPELNSGFGLRTLATSSRGFNPLSYHCGSVWAHDTAIAVAGLARSGGPTARMAALSLIEGLLNAAEAFQYRLPELYGGQSRKDHDAPLPYPAACHPQAWTAASSVAVLAALKAVG